MADLMKDGSGVFFTGQGERLLFVHGGPGMSHDYFLPHILPLAERFELLLYTHLQTTFGGKDISLESMIAELRGLLIQYAPEKLLVHSFGGYLTLATYRRYPDAFKDVQHIYFICPQSTDAENDRRSMERRLNRLSATVQQQVTALKASLKGDDGDLITGNAYFSTIHPFDFVDPRRMSAAQNFDICFYRKIQAAFYDYDFSEDIQTLPVPFTLIQGDHDFIQPENVQPLVDHARAHHLIKDCGHYPFIEKPDVFFSLID